MLIDFLPLWLTDYLAAWLFLVMTLALMLGFPVTLTMMGVSFLFGLIGLDPSLFELMPLRMWGVILKSQGHQRPHIHPSAWISGCYYVRVPDAVSTATGGNDGWIEFGRPHPGLGAVAEPAITRVRPEEGRLVLFPSFFYHCTVPFTSDENRISIAFDVIPCD